MFQEKLQLMDDVFSLENNNEISNLYWSVFSIVCAREALYEAILVSNETDNLFPSEVSQTPSLIQLRWYNSSQLRTVPVQNFCYYSKLSTRGVACFGTYRLICHSNVWKRIDKEGVSNNTLIIDSLLQLRMGKY